jgi:hypothetical protein
MALRHPQPVQHKGAEQIPAAPCDEDQQQEEYEGLEQEGRGNGNVSQV